MHLTFATGNPGKIREARARLGPLGHEVEQWDKGYPELQTDTLQEVAAFGLEQLEGRIDPPFLLEDAGLFVDALGGFPGVYSSYVFQTLGWEGILSLLAGQEGRSARFEAVVGFYDGEQPRFFQGVVEGAIADEGRGEHGFGFDPIFVPEDHRRTFAEMTLEEKGKLSHRRRALDALADHLGRAGQA